MTARLVVDTHFLRQTAASIDGVKQAMTGMSDLISQYEDAIGDASLRGALDDFANNWKVHREKVVEDLETWASWTRKAAESYEQTDQGLGKALAQAATTTAAAVAQGGQA